MPQSGSGESKEEAVKRRVFRTFEVRTHSPAHTQVGVCCSRVCWILRRCYLLVVELINDTGRVVSVCVCHCNMLTCALTAARYVNADAVCEGVWCLCCWVEQRLQHAFHAHDKLGSGKVSQDDFRDVLEEFGIRMNDLEFEKLLRAYDPSGTGKVSYLEFNKKMANVVHPSRSGALVVKPKKDGVLRRKRRDITTARFASEVEGKMARRVVQDVTHIARCFQKHDVDGCGALTTQQFMDALRESGLRLSSDELTQLVAACGTQGDGRISLVEFASHLTRTMQRSTERDANAGLHMRKRPANAPVVKLSFEAAALALQRKLVNRFASVKKAFRSFDVKGTGQVEYHVFRQVLRDFGVEVADDDFARLIRDFDPSGLGYVTYINFNNAVGTVITPGEDGLGVMLNRPSTPVLSEWVAPKWAQIAMRKHHTPEQLFDELDTDNSGAISIPEFIQALHASGFDLKPEEAMTMVEMFDRNAIGQVYRKPFCETVLKLLKMPTGRGFVFTSARVLATPPTTPTLTRAVAVVLGRRADPHAVPSAMHYTGVTQSARTVDNLFAHKLFSRFRTVKRAFQMVRDLRRASHV